MKRMGRFGLDALTGLWRAGVVAAVTVLVPAMWAAAVALAVLWSDNPWSWIPLVMLPAVGSLGLAQPVCRWVRSLVARWTGTVIEPGYREPPPVTQLSTGYWWNGYTYASSAKQARQEQEWRHKLRDPATWRDLRFAEIVALTAGLASLVPLAGIAVAVAGFATSSYVVGGLGLLAAIGTAPYAWRLLEPVAVRFLRPPPPSLADRVDELTAQRANTTIAQAAEIRRIERDLHDGAQARLVALGLSLATAEKLMDTDPRQAKALLQDARAGAATSLTELRELVKGINPPVLNERGLVDAVRAFALDSPLEITVDAEPVSLDPPIESAVYFAVVELVTNAVRHAEATSATISISRTPDLVVVVEDNGRGGAVIRAGGGLEGLHRRLAAFDGTVAVTSPAGGPTRVRMTVPCESS
ncbi:two-component sensor histidine kinase [Kribbella sp. ALI-6-A]|uniref:sensor histidine kinase n=1 Tax=Kribbella sp. ALI-6-A TaxID=1933817 RepID=UPI00097C97F8|nr:sensor histidine kinase [Kribbella sp. ALI-6-A]ONI74329.1 two-component sensor histidine kinase [Kribbella sp. ALI-6-A]